MDLGVAVAASHNPLSTHSVQLDRGVGMLPLQLLCTQLGAREIST